MKAYVLTLFGHSFVISQEDIVQLGLSILISIVVSLVVTLVMLGGM